MDKLKSIYELPYDVALEILTKSEGYGVEEAQEILAIARGESKGDVIEVGGGNKGARIVKSNKK